MSLNVIHLNNRLLFVNLYVLIGDYEAAQKWAARRFEELFKDEGPALGKAATFRDPRPDFGAAFVNVIYLQRLQPSNPFDVASLTHEALHVAWTLLEEYGCYDEETHCYLLQWIIERVLLKVRRK